MKVNLVGMGLFDKSRIIRTVYINVEDKEQIDKIANIIDKISIVKSEQIGNKRVYMPTI